MSKLNDLADEVVATQATKEDLIKAFTDGLSSLSKLTKGQHYEDEEEEEAASVDAAEEQEEEQEEEEEPGYAGSPDMNKGYDDVVDVTSWLANMQGQIETVLEKSGKAASSAEVRSLNARLGKMEEGLKLIEPLAKGMKYLLEHSDQSVNTPAPSKADRNGDRQVGGAASHPRFGGQSQQTGMRKASEPDLMDAFEAMNKGKISEYAFSHFKIHGVFSSDSAEHAALYATIKA